MKRLRSALLNRKDVVSGRIIVNILEKADPNGLMHGIAVAEITSIIGKQNGLGKTAQSELWLAGLLHDIGKLGVPSEILAKRDVTKSDIKYIQKHPAIGRFIADKLFFGGALGRTIEAHHERYDGDGYPKALSGDEIPWDARTIAIADYYDAARTAGWFFSHRSHEKVIDEIAEQSGKAFDPNLVEATLKAKSEIQITYDNIHKASLGELRKWL